MGTQLPPEKRHTQPHPIFGPCLLWPNGWMDEDTTCYGSKPRPRPHFIRRGASSRERGIAAPSFRPMCCGHGRPSQLLLSSCYVFKRITLNPMMESRDTCLFSRVSRDVVFHVSVFGCLESCVSCLGSLSSFHMFHHVSCLMIVS